MGLEAMFSCFRLSIEDRDYFFPVAGERRCRTRILSDGPTSLRSQQGLRRILEDTGASNEVIQALKEKMYVDLYLGSASSVTGAVEEAFTVKDS